MLRLSGASRRAFNFGVGLPDSSVAELFLKSWHSCYVRDLLLSYHMKETIFFTIDPYYGSLDY